MINNHTMSKYTYIVRNYHAIKEAVIKLDGITVLSGVNGCGKSTLSRWLYYIINGTNNFENFLYADYKENIRHLVNRMQYACMDLGRYNRQKHEQLRISVEQLYEIVEKLKIVNVDSKELVNTIYDLFIQALNTTREFLTLAFDENIPEARKARIISYLNQEIKDNDLDRAIKEFYERNERFINVLTNKLYRNLEERPYNTFFESINTHFSIDDKAPSDIHLEEDGVDILEAEHISTTFNLQRAIYVDTPMAIGAGETDNLFWSALRDMMISEENKSNSSPEKKLLARIKHLLHGEAVLQDDTLFNDKQLRYISSDNRINIDISKVATGFKTFSYLQRLMENGYLNTGTLLMIDEPEAHLHPQWIVEYARLLIMLNKQLGLKIMMASHNPDMVAAIHDIAYKEDILGNTNFYAARPDPDTGLYIYHELGHEIGEIFESFNIALENIHRYGAVGIQQ